MKKELSSTIICCVGMVCLTAVVFLSGNQITSLKKA